MARDGLIRRSQMYALPFGMEAWHGAWPGAGRRFTSPPGIPDRLHWVLTTAGGCRKECLQGPLLLKR